MVLVSISNENGFGDVQRIISTIPSDVLPWLFLAVDVCHGESRGMVKHPYHVLVFVFVVVPSGNLT